MAQESLRPGGRKRNQREPRGTQPPSRSNCRAASPHGEKFTRAVVVSTRDYDAKKRVDCSIAFTNLSLVTSTLSMPSIPSRGEGLDINKELTRR